MPLPASVTQVTITGDILHPITGAPAVGTVTFSMPSGVRTNDGHFIGTDPTVVTLVNGAFPANTKLAATDGQNVTPQGWVYTVMVSTDTYVGSFQCSLPSNQPTVAFSALVPVVTPPAVATYALLTDPRLSVRPYAPVALADGPTINTDASLGTQFAVTLGGNRTLANPTNGVDGQKVIWAITQDTAGGRTLTLGSAFDLGMLTMTLSTVANRVDYLGAVYRATAGKWDVLAFNAGY